MPEYWLVGKHTEIAGWYGSWEMQGLYATEQQAVARCEDTAWFVMPLELDAFVPTETTRCERSYDPLYSSND